MTSYEPSAYWEGLLEDEFDESGVGYPQLARSLNRAMYRSMERSVEMALKDAGVASPPQRVLDIGSGTGVWIEFWRRMGATEITGVDLTSVSVKRLQSKWPEHSFLQADVGDRHTVLPDDQDIISAMSVLLHIVDDDRFRQSFHNLAAALRPGGTLALIEPVVVHRWWGPPFGAQASSKARPLEVYRSALNDAGLELQLLLPATVLLANVIDTRTALAFRALTLYWDLLMRGVGPRDRPGVAIAALLRPLDRLAVRLAKTGPSAKVLLARRLPAHPFQAATNTL